MIRGAAALAARTFASPALADPCKAIPDRGPMPSYLTKGKTFSGPVVYVGDGDMICVQARPGGPLGRVEVRLSDFYAPELYSPGGREARDALSGLTMGRRAVCVSSHQNSDQVVAACKVGGVAVGDLMRRAGVQEGGNGR